jgi:hypothetical protein
MLALLGSVRSTRTNRRRCPCVSERSPRRRWWPSRLRGDWPGWPPPRRLRGLRVLRPAVDPRPVPTGLNIGRTTGPNVGPITGPDQRPDHRRDQRPDHRPDHRPGEDGLDRTDPRPEIEPPLPRTVGSGRGGVRLVPSTIPGASRTVALGLSLCGRSCTGRARRCRSGAGRGGDSPAGHGAGDRRGLTRPTTQGLTGAQIEPISNINPQVSDPPHGSRSRREPSQVERPDESARGDTQAA